jgi:hypothetical protein
MAASLKLFPGSTVRWCGRRYLIVDYAGLDAIIGREPGKRRPERIPVSKAKPDPHQADSARMPPESRQSHRRPAPSADNSRIHVFKGCFWHETGWPQACVRHEVPRTSLRCHLHIALPGLHLILRNQPAFANNVAFNSSHGLPDAARPAPERRVLLGVPDLPTRFCPPRNGGPMSPAPVN